MKRRPREIIFVERTVKKPIPPGREERIADWLADLLFQDFLERKGLKK